MVRLVVGAPGLGQRRLDLLDYRPHLVGALHARDPARAQLRRAADRRLARPADPERQRALHRLGLHHRVGVVEMLAVERDRLLVPQPRHNRQRLIGDGAAALHGAVGDAPFGRERAAHAEGRQQPPVAEEVDRRALLGQHQRVAEAHHDHVHAELEPLGARRQRRHKGHRLEHRLFRDQPIRLPDRVDAALLAEVDPAPHHLHVGKREVGDAHADAVAHARTPHAALAVPLRQP